MPPSQHRDMAPVWLIRSVAVRTRDGPGRLDQAYRRLMKDTPRDEASSARSRARRRSDAAGTPQSGK
jgi:hypothetical protein